MGKILFKSKLELNSFLDDNEALMMFWEYEKGWKLLGNGDIGAEGVENADQADFLSECGCDVAQGFLYDRPMPLEDFEKKYDEKLRGFM